MTKIKFEHDTMAMWALCVAIGEEHYKIDEMEVDENGYREVVFNVGGVELDFEKVVNRMDNMFMDIVTEKAKELLSDKYIGLINELSELEISISNVRDRIENQKEIFKYEYELKQ